VPARAALAVGTRVASRARTDPHARQGVSTPHEGACCLQANEKSRPLRYRSFEIQSTPDALAVYASQPTPTTSQHSLASGRYPSPGRTPTGWIASKDAQEIYRSHGGYLVINQRKVDLHASLIKIGEEFRDHMLGLLKRGKTFMYKSGIQQPASLPFLPKRGALRAEPRHLG
jgi:hypothetical protein